MCHCFIKEVRTSKFNDEQAASIMPLVNNSHHALSRLNEENPQDFTADDHIEIRRPFGAHYMAL